MCTPDCFLFLLAVLFPPLPVWVKRGLCSADSIINLALCCLGWFPGLVHSWYIITKYPDPFEYTLIADTESGTASACAPRRSGRPHPSYRSERMVVTIPAPAVAAGYGTVSMPPPQQQQGPRTPERYTQHLQQTPPESDAAGPSGHEPPSYASAVSGDHKIQHP